MSDRRATFYYDLSSPYAYLAAIPNFGKKSIDEVVETLRARGLELRAA